MANQRRWSAWSALALAHGFVDGEAHPGADDAAQGGDFVGAVRKKEDALPRADPVAHREAIAGVLVGDVFERGQMRVGDRAHGAEEAAIVLGEVGSGGGVGEQIAQVFDRGGGDQPIELADVVVLHAVQLAQQ